MELRCENLKSLSHFMATLSMKYRSRPSHHLFPNLQSFVWESQETQVSLAHLFLPPSLRCLELDFDYMMQPGARTILLFLECQNIQLTQLCIRISPSDGSPRMLAAVLQALKSRSCQQLGILDCGLVDESILSYLAQLPTLKDLSVELRASISNTIASNKGFANLQALSLDAGGGGGIGAVISFLEVWSAQLSLYSIAITFSAARESQIWLPSVQQVISRISNGLCRSSLTRIEIRNGGFNLTGRVHAPLDITTLRPLLSFSKLEHLRLNVICSVDLNDDNLTELANAWPRLKTLVLNEYNGWQRTSGISFTGLATLLRACPLLEELALSIDATQLTFASTTRSGEEIRNDKITTIGLGDSTIDNPAAVASILRGLFRALTAVTHFGFCASYDDMVPLWDEVNSLLVRTRKQELEHA
ncbi:hypothetical protein BJ138DRAFT_371077 [Hygrophoropsis aurantiaca]|uniref:Uncharacterized protein n=1 Tax=Hygrophoropsis aurantiaca TaxID=72124 RepID=A0ACB8A556_9AGAM|nr:hypothetical protein BJ138DRAFT_371077 [Hygrophoropsis aurantiaca]